jgi:hypothetical protein
MSPQFDLHGMNMCRDLAMGLEIDRLDHVSLRHGQSTWPASRTRLASAGLVTIDLDLL